MKAIAAGSDALYRLENRLLDQVPRERVYARAFFYHVRPIPKRAPRPI